MFDGANDTVVVRCDTTLTFTNPASWQSNDARLTDGLPTQGYEGVAFSVQRPCNVSA